MKNKFLIIIPTYNEEKSISKVLKQLKETDYDFMVVNDGSTDNTLDAIFKEVNYCIGYSENQGKGYAVKLGAKYAFCIGYEWILIMDSDGQMSIDDIQQFRTTLNMPCYEEARLILGNRLHNPKTMPFIRKITNYIMSYFISNAADTYIADSQCGFRAIHKDIFELDLKGERFDLESEMIIKAGRAKKKIINVPIKCIYNKNRQSKIQPVKDFINFIKILKFNY